MTSLGRNIFSNYVSKTYVTLIGIIMIPIYIKHMGIEAYGLVSFFAVLQACFMLLDMGLTPTMAREMARYNGGAIDALSLFRLLRALEGVFVAVGTVGAAAMIGSASFIANNWLKVQELPATEVRHALMLMAGVVALRWVSGLYRAAITGFERLVWLGTFNTAIATARFVLVIPFLVFVSTTPTGFFGYQLVVAVCEVVMLVAHTYSLLPRQCVGQRLGWQIEPLRKSLRFSLAVAFASSLWVLMTQTDKLVLSKILSLADFAHFALAALVASGVMQIAEPISSALLPRLTKLYASGDQAGLIHLYRDATQMVAVVVFPAVLLLAFFSEQILWAWGGDRGIAHTAGPILTLYALGYSAYAFASFPYYLQYARGELRLHIVGITLFMLVLLPSLVWASSAYGVVGAGYAWLGANLAYFLIWVPQLHHRFLNGLHLQWLMSDVGSVAVAPALGAILMHKWISWPTNRVGVTLLLLALGLALLMLAGMGSSWLRRQILGLWRAQSSIG